jgi:hypothetical protein
LAGSDEFNGGTFNKLRNGIGNRFERRSPHGEQRNKWQAFHIPIRYTHKETYRLKKKALIISSLIIIGILGVVYFKPFSSPEIIVLDHLTENHDGIIDQICMVNNPPLNSKRLPELITEFNKNNQTDNGNFRRLFIKQHDYKFFPALTLSENIDYTSKMVTRNDLDNIDFLGSSSSFLTNKGERMYTVKVNVGKIWYYKK